MAIEKMHFINIVGPIKKLDEFVMDGILPFHVELVQAMSVLDGDKKGVYPFIEPNPYEGLMKKVKALEERTKPFSLLDMETVRQKTMAVEEMEEKVDQFIHELAKWYQERWRLTRFWRGNKRYRRSSDLSPILTWISSDSFTWIM